VVVAVVVCAVVRARRCQGEQKAPSSPPLVEAPERTEPAL
jgi:hypothetical protein